MILVFLSSIVGHRIGYRYIGKHKENAYIVHLLVRTGDVPLSKLMARLLTGYASSFNRRYKRVGHLFQKRYKSIVCQEEPYLRELVRYIHLNPWRAGLVKDYEKCKYK